MTHRTQCLSALGIAVLFLLPTSALADDPTLESLDLGKYVCGEKWDQESLKGRTILAYFWDPV
jgi:hypothetical protein